MRHKRTPEEKERIHEIWRLMVGRCHNPNWKNYFTTTYYRDKGITVCDTWRYDFHAFKDWALANGYADDLSIDRIDPDGNYEPQNCRWITLEENRKRARRPTGPRAMNKNRRKGAGNYEVQLARMPTFYMTIESGLMYREAKQLQRELQKKPQKTHIRSLLPCSEKPRHRTTKFVNKEVTKQ